MFIYVLYEGGRINASMFSRRKSVRLWCAFWRMSPRSGIEPRIPWTAILCSSRPLPTRWEELHDSILVVSLRLLCSFTVWLFSQVQEGKECRNGLLLIVCWARCVAALRAHHTRTATKGIETVYKTILMLLRLHVGGSTEMIPTSKTCLLESMPNIICVYTGTLIILRCDVQSFDCCLSLHDFLPMGR